MAPIRQIEVLMTGAFLLYLLAFFSARRRWELHLFSALLGFVLDMYATYLMVKLVWQGEIGVLGGSPFLTFHAGMAVLAIVAFGYQAYLGVRATSRDPRERTYYRERHIGWAKYGFLPTWTVAYLSGFALVL